ncbi:MAG: DivIVA domain-containing protein [Myxococcota bacterium]|nr:DivIVA domain-containing protein [Myxococcota bacterium]
MRLSPLDIQNHRFSPRMRGIDREEVETFLQLVAEDYEELLRERDALRDRTEALEIRIEDLTATEKALQDTLVTAQQLSEDLKRTAMREGEVKVAEAEVQAERVLQAAHRRAARLTEDIRELRALRSRLGESLRTSIETHLALIDTLTVDPEEVIDAGAEALLARAPGDAKPDPPEA